MLASRPDLTRGQYDARHWEGLLAAAALLTIPRVVAEGKNGGRWAAAAADGELIAIAPVQNEGAFVVDARSRLPRAALQGGGRPLGFSADRGTVWTFDEQSLRSFESHTGKPLRTLPCGSPPIRAAALSKDGRRIAVASSGPQVEVWDAETGRRIGDVLALEQAAVAALSFSPDGKELAVASADGTVAVHALPTGRAALRIPGGAAIRAVDISKDGTRLCTAGDDGTLRVHDKRTGQILKAFSGYRAPINTAQFMPGDYAILTASDDGVIRLWELEAGRPVSAPKGHSESVDGAAFFDQGRRILTWGGERQRRQWSYDQTLRVWDADTGRSLTEDLFVSMEQLDKGDVGSVLGIDPNGGILITGRAFAGISIRDAPTLKRRHQIDYEVIGDHSDKMVTPDARFILIVNTDPRRVLLFSSRGGRQIGSWNPNDSLTVRALSPDGKRLLATSPPSTPFEESAGLFDSASGRPLLSLKSAERVLSAGGFSPDGKRVVGSDAEGTVGVWDARTGTRLTTFQTDAGNLEELRFSSGAQRILLRTEKHRLQVHDASSGRSFFSTALEPIGLADLSADGRQLVTTQVNEKEATVWDVDTGRAVLTLRGHRLPITAVAYSPDGRRILTASADLSVTVWSASDGKRLVRFGRGLGQDDLEPREETAAAAPANLILARLAVPAAIDHASFSSDGSQILTATGDEVIAWDSSSYRWRHWLDNRGTSAIHAAGFSADGARVLMATSHEDPHEGRSADVYRWDALTGEPRERVNLIDQPLEHTSIASHGKILAALIRPAFGPHSAIDLRDANDGKLLKSIPIPESHARIDHILFSPDGSQILTVAVDSVELWSTTKQKRVLALDADKTRHVQAAFSPDGKLVATAGKDGVARIHDTETGRVRRRYAGHKGPLTALQFSPDGMRLATTGKDSTVRVWDVESGQPLIVHELPSPATTVGFSPDGVRLIVAAKAAYVYSTRHTDYYAFACRVLRSVLSVPEVPPERLREALSSCP